ncbi:MAG: SPOR domain-containing protein [Sphingobium sp.]
MSDFARDSFDLADDDRLPWLEPADDYEDGEDGVSPLRVLGIVLMGLVLLGLVVGLVYYLRNRDTVDVEGAMIAAPKGSYKVAANEADAKKFAGEGDASYAASEGMNKEGHIDPSRMPEVPLGAGASGSDPALAKGNAATKPGTRVTSKVADDTSARPATVAPPIAKSGGAMVQLGAYGSNAIARDAWGKLSKRFDYLAALSTSVQPVTIGGTTFYRLRAGTGNAANASTICGKLKVAGESCMVVN